MNPEKQITQKKWNLKALPPKEKVNELKRSLGVNKITAQILVQRGIDTKEKAAHFLNPKTSMIHDPFLMKNMDEAVDRLEEALGNGERIMVYGDYDVDGTTAVALVFGFLRQYYDNLEYYIPDRYSEGYGLSEQGIKTAKKNGVSLVIALDCGITAIKEVDLANELGIDLIICDHHLPGEELPDAYILNPKQAFCEYPYKELSGCGVGFKFMQALAEKNDWNQNKLWLEVDLVAISIACDIVDMTGENRVLSYAGMKLLNKHPRSCLKKLLELDENFQKLSTSDVVFKIGPKINAAGRIFSGSRAVAFLLSENNQDLDNLVIEINNYNKDRKELDKDITENALHEISSWTDAHNRYSTVISGEEWHKGVIGIVASRLIENYYRPTVVFSENDGILSGSVRSIPGVSAYECLNACSDYIIQFGGHDMAAGLTIKKEKFEGFRNAFEQEVAKRIKKEELIESIDADLEIDFHEIQEGSNNAIPVFYKVLDKLSPFGPGNMRPTFITRGVSDSGFAKLLKDEHLKFTATQKGKSQDAYAAIAFRMPEHFNCVKNETFDLIYTIEKNVWNGRENLQLMVKDIKPS